MINKEIHFFEHTKKNKDYHNIDEENFKSLEVQLQKLWEQRKFSTIEDNDRFKRDSVQKILKFNHSKGEITPLNYVGVIKTNDHIINIYPKIFYSIENEELVKKKEFSNYIFAHLLWWTSYSDKISLPKNFASFKAKEMNLLEILIYFFSYYTENLISNFSFNDYEVEESELSMVKGKIKFNDYVANMAREKWHTIPCEYSEFKHNNLLNQIIKYVSKILLSFSKNKENISLLNSILFELNEVSDKYISIHDCDKIKLNPLYTEYNIVLDYCKMILSNCVTSQSENDLNVFSFLIETSSIYEDFLKGFCLRKNIVHKMEPKESFLSQSDNNNLKAFKIKTDYSISLKKGDEYSIIGDAKYKRIYKEYSREEKDGRKTYNYGIKNSDIFQMITYAFHKNINQIVLLYPNYYDNINNPILHKFKINSTNESQNNKISIKAATVNIIDIYHQKYNEELSINDIFGTGKKCLEERLKIELNSILNPTVEP